MQRGFGGYLAGCVCGTGTDEHMADPSKVTFLGDCNLCHFSRLLIYALTSRLIISLLVESLSPKAMAQNTFSKTHFSPVALPLCTLHV